jgi:NADPH-dependent 2,4-dienoyl-CoA reductase/sulfur reductase-like enzyme/nitrite reductase/ring-hydroxylating ferredoxin subunit
MNERKIAVANVSALKDGEMKEVSVDGTPILLARVAGEYHALAAHCTHYGAPLSEGFLSGDRIVCPWHHACFNARSGELEEPPALDSLPCFDVSIEDNKIFVELPRELPDRRTPETTKRDPRDTRTFVILGGGAAGCMAAQTLREDGFTGRIVMITRENRAPYDRPNLSKDYLAGNAEPEWMPLRSEEFFDDNQIEILKNAEVTSVDAGKKTIGFKDGSTMNYDSLLVASGGEPRRLPFQNEPFDNVFLLRTFADADTIIGLAESGKHAVVIGASFIGMEAASSLRQRGCDVTVVSPDEVPFQKILGEDIGKMFKDVHEQNGVRFSVGSGVTGFEGTGQAETVVLKNGERLAADFVLVGIGVKPNTDFLEGVTLHNDGGVITDEHLLADEDIYAAGDIAHFPDPRTGEMTRIEHWRTSLQLGRTAAHNMAGKRGKFAAVPFFWTTQFDVTLNYVGHARSWDEIVFHGDLSKHDFLAFYVKDFRILAVAGMNRDRELAVFEELIRLNRVPAPDVIRDGSFDILKLSQADHVEGTAAHAII